MRGWMGLGMVLVGLGCAPETSGSSAASSSSSSGGSSGSASVSSGGMQFTVGTAVPGGTHADVANGSTVDVVFGPQGGYHIHLSVGLPSRPTEEYPLVGYEVKDSTTVYARGTTSIAPHQEGAQWVDVGAYMFFDWGVDPTAWRAHPLDVTVRLLSSSEAELGRVTRQWLGTCCTGGGGPGGGYDGGPRDGEGGDGGVGGNGGVTCEEFCARVMNGCASANAGRPFSTSEACLSQCATWPHATLNAVPGGNTLVCRDHYARLADEDTGTCVRLQETWDNLCVDH